ncbi:pentapeptide repeat-containing protein [Micromonospora sp. NPDC085948]|uniref:pentapeptide repeat-containing protein n=1 Tax=Micromonospora sp. NPDC085948 TaxID=3155293 RepID=UPI003435BA7D
MSIYYTGRSVDATNAQVRLQEQGQVTDRFARAVEQLGSEQISVRLGAVYSLERLMRDSAADQPTVVEVLSGFVRDTARRKDPELTTYRPYVWPNFGFSETSGPPRVTPRTDVQAAITVIGRRDSRFDGAALIDLTNVDLGGISMRDGNFMQASLRGSSLFRADLVGSNLEAADLTLADLAYSYAERVNLQRASMEGARIRRAQLSGADFRWAQVPWVDGRDAVLVTANLSDATLDYGDLSGARLDAAQLDRAALSEVSFQDAFLNGARGMETAFGTCVNLRGAQDVPPPWLPDMNKCG